MARLSQAQKSMLNRARAIGSGQQAVKLDDPVCVYLLARIVADLNRHDHFPEIPPKVPAFYASGDLAALRFEGIEFLPLMERLCGLEADADTYFVCLANLHMRRLKYQEILRTQPMPSMDQVGPRGLLQFGTLPPAGLTGLLFWRKWIYDTDNRAAQETGYVFEPIIASAIGGTPFGQTKSPVKRAADTSKRRQVDCILDSFAYEFKIRVTIAASGQGRWKEELQFPEDCRSSGYVPRLVVLDPTPNPKLSSLETAFIEAGGEVFIGEAAWEHLDAAAGPTMATFLETYVRIPVAQLLDELPSVLPSIRFEQQAEAIRIAVGDDELLIKRAGMSGLENSEETGLAAEPGEGAVDP